MPYTILPPSIDPRLLAFDQLMRWQQEKYWQEKGEPKESGAFINAAGALPGAATGLKYGMMTGNPYAAAGMTVAGGAIGHFAGPKRLHPGEGPYAHPGNIQQSDQQIMQGAMQLMNAGGSAIAGGMGGDKSGDAERGVGEVGSQYAGPPASEAPQQSMWGRLGDKFKNFDWEGASDALMDSGQVAPNADYRQRQMQQQQEQRLWQQKQAGLQKKAAQIQSDPPGTWQFRTPSDEKAYNMWMTRLGVAERNENKELSQSERKQIYAAAEPALRPIVGRMYKNPPPPTIKEEFESGQNLFQDGNQIWAKYNTPSGPRHERFTITPRERTATEEVELGYTAQMRPGLWYTNSEKGKFFTYDPDQTVPEPTSDDWMKARKQAATELKGALDADGMKGPVDADAINARTQAIMLRMFPRMNDARYGSSPGIDRIHATGGRRVPMARGYSGGDSQFATGSSQPPGVQEVAKLNPYQLEETLAQTDVSQWSTQAKIAALPAARQLWKMLQPGIDKDADFDDFSPNKQALLLNLYEIFEAEMTYEAKGL